MPTLKFSFIVLLSFSSAHVVSAADGDDKPKKRPAFKAVKAMVHKEFAGRKGYHSGDILTRKQVRKALDAVEKSGWKIKDRKAIVGSFLTDGDDLVRQLRTARGTKFMRKLSGTPRAYDRLDRLRRLKYGNRRIRELIIGPDGHTMILYMATTPGGRKLGRYLNKNAGGKNFNKRTRRLYTEKQLLKRLKRSYDGETKLRKAK